jgi:hypothetical protein
MTSIKYILEAFKQQGVDDLEIKKEGNLITIGYFNEAPVDCIKIRGEFIEYIIFNRQEKLNWLFSIYDKKIKIIDDYFNENKEENKMEDRKIVLLKACRDLLKKQERSGYVLDLLSETVEYDDTECDGSCLLSEIEDELENPESEIKEE